MFSKLRHLNIKRFVPNKKASKKLFIVWVLYQAVKGIITTSLIWIPLLWHFWNK